MGKISVTRIDENISLFKRYRIVGEPEREDWARTLQGKEPWCEVSLSSDGKTLCSFGGNLWPSAWPSLFDVGPRTIYGQETRLTDLALELFLKADGGNV